MVVDLFLLFDRFLFLRKIKSKTDLYIEKKIKQGCGVVGCDLI